jgi:phosphatidylcholine synthase
MTAPVLAAWGVHLYTAFGAVLGFLALEATSRGRYGLAFCWLAVATFVDCTDGTLARRARVKQVLPQFDGARLDDIVDYLNYVLVPMVLAYHAGLIPRGPAGLAVGALPLLASGYGFCQIDAKTEDHFFKGFPSYWNIVVFYLYALASPLWFNNAVLVLLSILVFVPIRYLYPSKNKTAQRTTYVLGAGWGLCMLVLLAQFPTPSRGLSVLSLFFPIYYFAISLHLHFRRA